MRTESWCGHDIRFVDPDMLTRVRVNQEDIPGYNVLSNTRIEDGLNDINSRGAKSFWMLAANEIGIYEALANTI